MDSIIIMIGAVAFRFAAQAAADNTDSGNGWSVFVPIITALIVLVGTYVGVRANRSAGNQRLAFERAQWEAAEADRKRQADRAEDDRRRDAERAQAEELQAAVRRECGECMDKVRGLLAQLDDYTNRLLAAHELIGQKERQIIELEHDLAKERSSRE